MEAAAQFVQVCGEMPERGEAFKNLLLLTAQRMKQEDSEQLAFLTTSSTPVGGSNLQLLQSLRNSGEFGPFAGSRLEELLRKINRYDLADGVSKYVEVYPDSKRNRSLPDTGNVSPYNKKRSSTEPSPSAHSTPRNHLSRSPQVYQEQGKDMSAEFHVSMGIQSPPAVESQCRKTYSTPSLIDISSNSPPVQVSGEANISPPSSLYFPSHAQSSHTHPTCKYSRHIPQRSFIHDHSSVNMNFSLPGSTAFPRSVSRNSQEPLGYYSNDASSESSLHSLPHPPPQPSNPTNVYRIARNALEMVMVLLPQSSSQEAISEQCYRSSQSSMASSQSGCGYVYCSDPVPGQFSFHSDSEGSCPPIRRKEYSHSCHGPKRPENDTHRCHAAHSRGRSFHSTSGSGRDHEDGWNFKSSNLPPPPPFGSEVMGYSMNSHIPGLTMKEIMDERKEEEEEEEVVAKPGREAETSQLTPRPRCESAMAEVLHSHSSEDIPPITEYEDKTLRPRGRRRALSDFRGSHTPRESVYSEATSEGTIVSPRTSLYGRDFIQDSDDVPTNSRHSPSPSKPFPKEKSLWKKLSLFRGKSRQASNHSLTWKVAREDLMKPVWRHEDSRCITRPHKFELDASLGKHNPKLSFSLYPCGQFVDAGKSVTMGVRIFTSDKCPPLPPSSKIHLSLVVWDGEREGEGRELNRRHVAERLNMRVIYIHGLITHQLLKDSRSKYFYLDFEVSCSAVNVHQKD